MGISEQVNILEKATEVLEKAVRLEELVRAQGDQIARHEQLLTAIHKEVRKLGEAFRKQQTTCQNLIRTLKSSGPSR